MELNASDRRDVFYAFKYRYEHQSFNKELMPELDWLRTIKNSLLEIISKKEGKMSSYIISSAITDYIDTSIED